MARAPTTTDAFNAVAEPRRRQILTLLRTERSVSELVQETGIVQPLVSKHLKVLRDVGLVEVRDVGRQRMYRVNGRPLKEIYDWVRPFEQLWTERFTLMDDVLDELKENDNGDDD